MNQNERLVPHFKHLIYICLEVDVQVCGMTFRVLYAISKRPYFPYELPKSRVSLQTTVTIRAKKFEMTWRTLKAIPRDAAAYSRQLKM